MNYHKLRKGSIVRCMHSEQLVQLTSNPMFCYSPPRAYVQFEDGSGACYNLDRFREITTESDKKEFLRFAAKRMA